MGEEDVPLKDTPYAKHTPIDWCLEFIEHYGQIDGEHHKLWVIDQVVRLLKGTLVIVKRASWEDGTIDWRFWLDEPTTEYTEWVVAMRRGDAQDGEDDEYDYDEGIAP